MQHSIPSARSTPQPQAKRVPRATDNRYFNSRVMQGLVLKRRGYELDMMRSIEHARQNGCYLEISRPA